MKAEHRKELQTNALADRLGRLLQGVQSKPSSGVVLFGGLIVLAVAILLGWRYYYTARARSRSALRASGRARSLAGVGSRFAGTARRSGGAWRQYPRKSSVRSSTSGLATQSRDGWCSLLR